MYLRLFGAAIRLFPRRKFIPTKHLRHSGSFPVQWTWMTCLFLNWTWECDVRSKILSRGIHVTAFIGWPMLNNAGNSFENLTWCSELDYIFTVVDLHLNNIKQKITILWYDINDLAKTAFNIFNPFCKSARMKDRFFMQMSRERMIYRVNGSLPHDWNSVKMSRFHGSITRIENWPLIRANKQHNFHLTAGCFTENSISQFSKVYLSVRGWLS